LVGTKGAQFVIGNIIPIQQQP